jgi:hypothetical protein
MARAAPGAVQYSILKLHLSGLFVAPAPRHRHAK